MDSEGERQATALKCWTDRSQSAIRFQLAKFRVSIFSSALACHAFWLPKFQRHPAVGTAPGDSDIGDGVVELLVVQCPRSVRSSWNSPSNRNPLATAST